jgi:uncharacterized protein
MSQALRVLVATKGHAYDRNAFTAMLDALPSVDCTQVEQPAAQVHFSPEEAAGWNAYLLYDMPGYEFHRDHSSPTLFDPPEQFRRDFSALVERGHGFVFLHHAAASWPTWPEYSAIIGARFRFVREDTAPDSGYRHAVPQRVTAIDPDHPILAGLADGFEIVDEAYLMDIDEAGIVPLLTTDAALTQDAVWSTWNAVLGRRDTNDGWVHPPGSGVVAWVRPHPHSRIVYIQFGDSASAFGNENFRTLLDNALTWVASDTAFVRTESGDDRSEEPVFG